MYLTCYRSLYSMAEDVRPTVEILYISILFARWQCIFNVVQFTDGGNHHSKGQGSRNFTGTATPLPPP